MDSSFMMSQVIALNEAFITEIAFETLASMSKNEELTLKFMNKFLGSNFLPSNVSF